MKISNLFFRGRQIGPSINGVKSLHEEDHNAGYVFIITWIVVLSVTYILPDNILDSAIILKMAVSFISDIVPSIKRLSQYSNFPQVAQLVYVVGLIASPLLYKPISNTYKPTRKRIEIWTKRPAISLIASLIFICCMMIYSFIIFPGEPSQERKILLSVYHLKFNYAVAVTLVLLLNMLSVVVFVVSVSNIMKIISDRK